MVVLFCPFVSPSRYKNDILRTATEASLIKFYSKIKHNKRVITRFRFDAHGPGHNPVSGHNVSNWVSGITYIFKKLI